MRAKNKKKIENCLNRYFFIALMSSSFSSLFLLFSRISYQKNYLCIEPWIILAITDTKDDSAWRSLPLCSSTTCFLARGRSPHLRGLRCGRTRRLCKNYPLKMKMLNMLGQFVPDNLFLWKNMAHTNILPFCPLK